MTAAASGRVWASEGPVISYSTKLSRQGGLVWNDPSAGAAAQNAAKLFALFTGMTAKQYLELDAVDRGPLYHDGSLLLPISNSIRSAGGPQLEIVNAIRQLQNNNMAAGTGGNSSGAMGGALYLQAVTGLIIENIIARRLTAECCRVASMSRVSNVLTVVLHPSGRPAPWIVGEAVQGNDLGAMDFNPSGTAPAYTGGWVLSVSADRYTVVIQQTGLADATWNAAINATIVRAWRLKNYINFEVSESVGAYIRPGYIMSVTGGRIRPRQRANTTLTLYAITAESIAAGNRVIGVASKTGLKVNGHIRMPGGVLPPDTAISKINPANNEITLNKTPLLPAPLGTQILSGDTSLEVQSLEVARIDGQIISFRDAGVDDIGTLDGAPVLTQDPTTSRGQISGWRGAETRDNTYGFLDYGSIGTVWRDVTCSGQGGMVQGGVDHQVENVGAIDTIADGWRWRGQVGGHHMLNCWSENTGDDGIAVLGGEGLGRGQRSIRIEGFRAKRSRARGVTACGISNLEVVDSTASYCLAAGVHVESGGVWGVLPGNDVSIERNTMHSCGSSWTSQNSICGGIGIYGGGTDVRLISNRVFDSHYHGIWCNQVGKLTLDDNLVSWTPVTNINTPSQVGTGISIEGVASGTYESDIRLTRNVVREAANCGFLLSSTGRGKLFADDNTVEDIGRGVSVATRRGFDAVGFAGDVEFGAWTHDRQNVNFNVSVLLPSARPQQARLMNGRRVFPMSGGSEALFTKRDHRSDGNLYPDQSGANIEFCGATVGLTAWGVNGDQQFILTERARINGFAPVYLRLRSSGGDYYPGVLAANDIPFCRVFRDAAGGGGNVVFTTQNGAGTSNVMRQPGSFSGNYIGRPPVVLRPTMVNGSSVLRFSWANRMDDITIGMDVSAASGLTGMPFVIGVNPENQTIALSVAVPGVGIDNDPGAGVGDLGKPSWSLGAGGTRLTAQLTRGSPTAILSVACPVQIGTQAIFGRGIPFADALEGTADTLVIGGFGTTTITMDRNAEETGTFPVSIYQPHYCSASQNINVTFSGYNPPAASTRIRELWARAINFGHGNMPTGISFEVYGTVGEAPVRQRTVPPITGGNIYTQATANSPGIAVNLYNEIDIGPITANLTVVTTGTVVNQDRLTLHFTRDAVAATYSVTLPTDFVGMPAAFTTGGGASTSATIEFVRKGSQWRFVSWSGWNS